MKRKLILLFLILMPLFCTSQISFNNNILTGKDWVTTARNFNGTKIKEIQIMIYDLCDECDTTGRIYSREFFDEKGNNIQTFYYEGKVVIETILYEYDSLNKMIRCSRLAKDTSYINEIKFDENGNMTSYKETYAKNDYAKTKIRYTPSGLPSKQTIEIYFRYSLRFVRFDNYETLGYSLTKDSKMFYAKYKYYIDEEPVMKSNADKSIANEYCKLDKSNRLIRRTTLNDGNVFQNISIKYDQNDRVLEALYTSDLGNSYKHVYTYLYY